MPWGDRTGPVGAGPRTGRGLGFCNGYATAGYLNGGFGRGAGWSRGFGFGRRAGFGRGAGFGYGYGYGYGYAPAPLSKEDEKSFLENEIDRLTNTVEGLRKRLNELKD